MSCLYPKCSKKPHSRGLCFYHYKKARMLVAAGSTTWASLEASGKCKPAYQKKPNWFLSLPIKQQEQHDAAPTQEEIESEIRQAEQIQQPADSTSNQNEPPPGTILGVSTGEDNLAGSLRSGERTPEGSQGAESVEQVHPQKPAGVPEPAFAPSLGAFHQTLTPEQMNKLLERDRAAGALPDPTGD